jgi:2-(1,2-epoxy-1,2-dihydrophenyl)acetyl-CoA isomerase
MQCTISSAPSGALSMSAVAELDAALTSLDPNTRVVVLLGDAGQFCRGGDVAAFADADRPDELVADMAAALQRLVERFAACPVPIVAMVEGWAAGAGLSLVCAADLVICGQSARFATAYGNIGYTPDGGLTWTLPRIVGRTRARELLLTGRAVDATEAYSIGLVSRVVPDQDLGKATDALIDVLLAASAGATGETKRLLELSTFSALSEQLTGESETIARRAVSRDGREGVRAFLSKRRPVFSEGVR